MMNTDLQKLFQTKYGSDPVWGAKAPGRVNLIGEHIDYNGGYVLPIAITRSIQSVAGPSKDQMVHLYSQNFKQSYSFSPDSLPSQKSDQNWPNYFIAVVEQMKRLGLTIPPLNVVLDGDVPTGSGLSSSAAYEVCVATLLLGVIQNNTVSKTQIALLAQAAEHSEWVGVKCGIMDQYISVFGKADHAILLDCAKMESKTVPLGAHTRVLVIHSTVHRRLAASEYNERRSQCETALDQLNQFTGKKKHHLVDYCLEDLNEWKNRLDDVVFRRARHVVTEQARVLETIRALEGGHIDIVGTLLNESHTSLRDDYEVSCDELDLIHEMANQIPGVLGCRLTGAGFGGCAVALLAPLADELTVTEELIHFFKKKTGKSPWAFTSPACEGAHFWIY